MAANDGYCAAQEQGQLTMGALLLGKDREIGGCGRWPRELTAGATCGLLEAGKHSLQESLSVSCEEIWSAVHRQTAKGNMI